MNDTKAAVERAKQEIVDDVIAGHVPADVAEAVSELHEHADANMYGWSEEFEFDEDTIDEVQRHAGRDRRVDHQRGDAPRRGGAPGNAGNP